MTLGFISEERGQALVIVGGAMVVLMAALVLSVEWGYGFAQRRGAQNDADAAALAVGRHLASTFLTFDRPFGATVDELCLDARRFGDPASGEVLTLTFADESRSVVPFIGGPPAQSVSTSDCAAAAGRELPADQRPGGTAAVFVQVRATRTYASIFGGVFGRVTMDAAASARTRLTSGSLLRPLQLPADTYVGDAGSGVSGLSTAPSVALWPFVRYFDPAEFTGTPCGAYCVRTAGNTVHLWERSGSPTAFKGLVNLSHFAWHGSGATVHQLITESDWSASSPAAHGHPNTARLRTYGQGGCAPLWDSQGQSTTRGLGPAARCDVPNWFNYGYRGSLSLDTNWSDTGSWGIRPSAPGYLGGVRQPAALPAGRPSCGGALPSFPRPSCGGAQVGDWVETVNGSLRDSDGNCDGECTGTEGVGDLTSTMLTNIQRFIAQYGRELPNSAGSKAVVVNVLMWDCAERYNGGTYGLIGGTTPPCPRLSDSELTSVARVHLVTVVPFTIYADGVTNNPASPIQDHLYGYWGDAFGDAGSCQRSWNNVPMPTACQLNPLMNSAFLVPGE
jgi:hypothetical protein